MATKSTLITWRTSVMRAAAAFSLVAISGFCFYVLFGNLGVDSTYHVILRVLCTILFVLVLPSFLFFIMNKSKSSVLQRTVSVLTIVTLVALALYFVGPLQDWLGIHCADPWGWNTEPCARGSHSWLFFILLYPYVFLPVVVAASGFLAYSLIQEARNKQSTGV